MTPESKVKAAVRKVLDALAPDVWYFMPVQRGLGCRRGVPDFIACCRGRFIGIETKAGRGRQTGIQKFMAECIMQAGGMTLVVNENNLDELRSLLAELLTGTRTGL